MVVLNKVIFCFHVTATGKGLKSQGHFLHVFSASELIHLLLPGLVLFYLTNNLVSIYKFMSKLALNYSLILMGPKIYSLILILLRLFLEERKCLKFKVFFSYMHLSVTGSGGTHMHVVRVQLMGVLSFHRTLLFTPAISSDPNP